MRSCVHTSKTYLWPLIASRLAISLHLFKSISPVCVPCVLEGECVGKWKENTGDYVTVKVNKTYLKYLKLPTSSIIHLLPHISDHKSWCFCYWVVHSNSHVWCKYIQVLMVREACKQPHDSTVSAFITDLGHPTYRNLSKEGRHHKTFQPKTCHPKFKGYNKQQIQTMWSLIQTGR